MTLDEAFADQSISCARLGSPFMAQLFEALRRCWPAGSALGRHVASYDTDIGPAGASLPLRIAGGLHALVLSRRDTALGESYPPNTISDDALATAVLKALTQHEAFLLDWVQSPPQTNEVRRSAALMAGAAVVYGRHDLPVFLSELGASGGLNLMWDRFVLALPAATLGATDPALALAPDWQGPLPPREMPYVAHRAGVDLNPLDPGDGQDMLRLMAFLWPDQPERLALTRAAAHVMTAQVDRGDAIDWLSARLGQVPEGHLHLIQHTVAWQYFPKAAQDRGRDLIETAGKRATADRPLAWLSLENDGDTTGEKGAAISLRIWPGDHRLDLGRGDFHGRWIRWSGVT